MQIIKNEITGWLNNCEYHLSSVFVNSMKDELINIKEQISIFVSETVYGIEYDSLLDNIDPDNITDYICNNGPITVTNADEVFKILRGALEDKVEEQMLTDFVCIVAACFLKLLELNFDELVKEYPQLRDEIFIEKLSSNINYYEFDDITLDNLKYIIENED